MNHFENARTVSNYSEKYNRGLEIIVNVLCESIKNEQTWKDERMGSETTYKEVLEFIREYGKFGLKQLIMFFIDHSNGIKWTYEPSCEALEAFFAQSCLFFNSLVILKEINKISPLFNPIACYIKPNESFSIGLWPGAEYNEDKDGKISAIRNYGTIPK